LHSFAVISLLGVTLRIFYSKFIGYDDKELFTKIKKGRFDIPAHVSEGARHLIQRILKVNPEERPTVDQVSI